MKLEKAIERGKHIALPLKTAEDHENYLALILLIEAAERFLKARRIEDDPDWGRLFSETKE